MICGNFNTTNYTAISCVLMAEKKQGTSVLKETTIHLSGFSSFDSCSKTGLVLRYYC